MHAMASLNAGGAVCRPQGWAASIPFEPGIVLVLPVGDGQDEHDAGFERY